MSKMSTTVEDGGKTSEADNETTELAQELGLKIYFAIGSSTRSLFVPWWNALIPFYIPNAI